MDGIIVPIEMPKTCGDCMFHIASQEIGVPGYPGFYEKISRCMFCPPTIEDGWRSLLWQCENKERWCPLRRASAKKTGPVMEKEVKA